VGGASENKPLMSNEDCPGTNNRGEPCGLDAGWGVEGKSSGPCKFHGGEGGDVGDPGGVPPEKAEGNQNAMKTGVHSDPVNLFEYLADHDPTALAYILDKLHEYAAESPREVFVVDITPDDVESFADAEAALTAYGDDLLLICIRDYTRWRATKRQVEEGLLTEQVRSGDHGPYTVTDSNPINLDLDRLDRTSVKLKDRFDLLPNDSADIEVSITGEFWEDLTAYYDDA